MILDPNKKFPKKFLDVFASKSNFKFKKNNIQNPQSLKIYKFQNKNFLNHSIKWLILVLILVILGGLFLIWNKPQTPKINFNPKEAEEYQKFYENFDFIKNLENLNSNNTSFFLNQLPEFLSFLGKNIILAPNLFKNILAILNLLDELSKNWPQIFSGNYAGDVLRQNIVNLYNLINELKNNITHINQLSDEYSQLFFWQNELNRFSKFLENFIAWMDGERRHVLVLFLNTSEMRPGGGFLGSYAHVIIENWQVKEIKVLDINEPDREFSEKIIPPLALQNKIKSFKAADANWFFDFSLSAQKVIDFLERSNFYKKDGIKFDGVIAITPKVAEDILTIVGPIEIEKNIVLDKNNFLFELQKIVEIQRENKNLNPKIVLSKFLEEIIKKLNLLDQKNKQAIFDFVLSWIQKRELALYLKDKNLSSFFEFYGLTPKIADLDQGFFGDYLAVVDANLASGKSDLFIKKIVNLKIQISGSGFLINELEIKRINTVDEKMSWWYKRPNEDFIQVFTPTNAELLEALGGENKKIYPLVNYKNEKYLSDTDLDYEKNIKTINAFPQIKQFNFKNKNVFATFITTLPQKISSLKLKYLRHLSNSSFANKNFTFILEKQVGDRGEYNIEIIAPPGFKFQETNSPIFEYKSQNLDGQTLINLLLIEEKI